MLLFVVGEHDTIKIWLWESSVGGKCIKDVLMSRGDSILIHFSFLGF